MRPLRDVELTNLCVSWVPPASLEQQQGMVEEMKSSQMALYALHRGNQITCFVCCLILRVPEACTMCFQLMLG